MQILRPHSPPASRQGVAPPLILLDELIVEILSWLPVKSLLKFRCVCKSWKSLISDPNFVILHLQRCARNATILLLWEQIYHNAEAGGLTVVPCSVRALLENPSSIIADDGCYRLNDNNGYFVIGSCNGLVCLVDCTLGNTFRHHCFYLWNPATRSRSEKLASLRVNGGLRSPVFRIAFGYDNLTDTFKLLAFRLDSEAEEESQKILVKVCRLGDNYWRNIHGFPVVPFAVPHVPEHNVGVYFSGTLNWLALRDINSDDYKWNNTITIDQLVIVSLDLGLETYKQFLLPSCLDEAPHVEPTIGVLMDCVCFSHDYKRTHFAIWQMKEFGVERSWIQFMKVSYQDLQIDCLEFHFPLLPLCMSDNGDVLIMARAEESQAILYNRRDNRVEQTELPEYICWNDTKDYVESLVSPYCN